MPNIFYYLHIFYYIWWISAIACVRTHVRAAVRLPCPDVMLALKNARRSGLCEFSRVWSRKSVTGMVMRTRCWRGEWMEKMGKCKLITPSIRKISQINSWNQNFMVSETDGALKSAVYVMCLEHGFFFFHFFVLILEIVARYKPQ
jgi:hypothetical protein